MPFLGKDWRSSGEHWIRTEYGWERSKVLECILYDLNSGLENQKVDQSKSGVKESIDTNDECFLQSDEAFFAELNLIDEQDLQSDDSTDDNKPPTRSTDDLISQQFKSLNRLNLFGSSSAKVQQPHILFIERSHRNRENHAPKASVSEVLQALDMPGAVRDIKRFNYVCRLVQIIINEKLNQLSGNAQRTIFMIVKHLLIQTIKTQENLSTMTKLLIDFKKKIQESYFYFHYVGSQKLCERHLRTINRWLDILENPNSRKVKRLRSSYRVGHVDTESKDHEHGEKHKYNLENISFDCKLEILRRLNNGLDLVNLSQCNKSFNDIIGKEIVIWKSLCQFHFHQQHLNEFLKKRSSIQTETDMTTLSDNSNEQSVSRSGDELPDLDWKLIYFKLKKRYGCREVYHDMVHKCFYCKCLFWQRIGHPCSALFAGSGDESEIEIRTEPITPKKLIDLLLK